MNDTLVQEVEELCISITHPSRNASAIVNESVRGFVDRHLYPSSNARPLRSLTLSVDDDQDWLTFRVGTLHIQSDLPALDFPSRLFSDVKEFSGFLDMHDDEESESDNSDNDPESMYYDIYGIGY